MYILYCILFRNWLYCISSKLMYSLSEFLPYTFRTNECQERIVDIWGEHSGTPTHVAKLLFLKRFREIQDFTFEIIDVRDV